MAIGNIHTNLIGRHIQLGDAFKHRIGEKHIWPDVEAALPGHHVARIVMLRIHDGATLIGCEMYEGTYFETWLTFHKLLPESEGQS